MESDALSAAKKQIINILDNANAFGGIRSIMQNQNNRRIMLNDRLNARPQVMRNAI